MIMVTGGPGHIGRRVLDPLSRSHEVINVDRVENPLGQYVRTVIADLAGPTSLDGIGGDYSAIVHLAAIPNPYVAPAADVMRVTMVGTFSVLQFAVPMVPGQTETCCLTAREHCGTLDTVEMAGCTWGDSLPIDRTYYADDPGGSVFDIGKAERELGERPEWTVERVAAEHTRLG